MGLRNGSLVCDNCWKTLFKFRNFQQALKTLDVEGGDLLRDYAYNTPTWKEIDDSKNAGCNWCDFLWEDILQYRKSRRDRHLRTEDTPFDGETWKITVRFRRSKELPHNMSLHTLIGEDFFPNSYEIHTTNDDRAADLVVGRNIIWEVASPASYSLSKECIEDCAQNHTCQSTKKPRLPSRVVDCKDPQNPKLCAGSGQKAHFAALSYVWGQAQPHSTYSTNIESYFSRIDIGVLPQTIVDAIKATHHLGLRYLWTDTLCIIQDSQDDKNNELPEMCNIYKNAYVTIIAACSKKAGDGFLHNRKNPVSTPLPFWLPSGELGTIHVREQERAPQNEPVNQRAWCFQERVLASRALIYASHTLQFQCGRGIKNVGGGNNFETVAKTEGLRIPGTASSRDERNTWYAQIQIVAKYMRRSALQCLLIFNDCGRNSAAASATAEESKPPDSASILAERKIWATWKEILAEYTRRSITNPADKLVALAGVADAFQRCWQDDTEYLAGLWRHTLVYDLIWYRARTSGALQARPQDYRAPSWSWAATDGPVDDGVWPGPIEPILHVRACTVRPAVTGLPCGEVRDGALVVESIVRRVAWGQNSSGSSAGDASLYEVNGGARREVGFVYYDCASEEDTEGFAVVVGEFNKRVVHHLIGLVVIPVEGRTNTYTRVGVFDVHAQITSSMADASWADEPYTDIHDWMSAPTQVITVI